MRTHAGLWFYEGGTRVFLHNFAEGQVISQEMATEGTSASSRSYSSDSESSFSSSSSSSSSSGSIGRKRKRKHVTKSSKEKHNCRSKRRFKDKCIADKKRDVKFKKSLSSKEVTVKDKPKKSESRRFSAKSECEVAVLEAEERAYKRESKDKEKRKRSKLRRKKKHETKLKKRQCNMEVLHENGFITGKRDRENIAFQAATDAKEQQKAIIFRNAELAKARLASEELQRARNEQMKMQDLYGTIDWRTKKKLRTEKRMLERTVAAGKKLASLDERETARMDAFRIALGLPTAEAQRQAEWRAEATQNLAEVSKGQELVRTASRQSKVIGPCLPRS